MPEKIVPMIKAKKTQRKNVILDPKGFFVIELNKGEIRVEHYSNVYKDGKIVTGKIKKVFVGAKADALSDTIAKYIQDLRPEHYIYLGRELMRAQIALEKNQNYVQGGC